MAPARLALSLLLHLLLAAGCCAGRAFVVGGRSGWTPSRAEPLNHWAERNRFQVNDSLVFRYSGDTDSVLVVSQSQYDACNTTAPYLRLEGGHSVFGLTHSGPYFFISGHAERCQAGERLIVVVLAVRAAGRDSPAPSSTPPPKSPSSSPSPPPVPAPPAAGNSSSTTPAPPALAPPPATNATAPAPPPATNTTALAPPPPHSSSSASALRAGVLAACLVIAGTVVLAA